MGRKPGSQPGFTSLAGIALFLLALVCAAPARAADADASLDLEQVARQYELLSAELDHAIRELEYPREIPHYPDRMLSHRKNATVTIGGEIRTDYVFSSGSVYTGAINDPFRTTSRRTSSRLADLDITTAKLLIDARANRWRGHLDINLNGYSGFQPVSRYRNLTAPGDPAPRYREDTEEIYVNDAYIELMKDGHSGFGFKAGLMEMPFGLQCRPNLIGRSFLDAPDLTGSYLTRPTAQDGLKLPHASRFLNPATAIMLSYELRDIIRFEAGVFQDNETYRWNRERNSTYTRLRNESSLLKSHQFSVSILPLEGWELTATYRNRHSRSRGLAAWTNSPYRWDFRNNLVGGSRDPAWDAANREWSDSGTGEGFGSRRNEQAFTIGLAVEIPYTMLSVQLEYARGLNQGFNKYINSDNVNLGLSYRLTPRLTLHTQGEWLHIKDRSNMAFNGARWQRDTQNNRLYRVLFGAEYELMHGLLLEAGWQYEYWNLTSSRGVAGEGDTDRTYRSNMLYMGTRFIF